jgi:NH3-dependent NAD+ synthetase
MGTWRVLSGAAIAALVLIVVGCGGGEDSSDANAISKQAFIKKADAVCQQSNKRMEAAFVDFLNAHKNIKKPSRSDYERLVGEVLVPNIRREIKEIQALGTPEDDGDRVDAMVDALEEGVETAENNPKAVANSSDAVFGIASRLAGEYGLTVCGSR